MQKISCTHTWYLPIPVIVYLVLSKYVLCYINMFEQNINDKVFEFGLKSQIYYYDGKIDFVSSTIFYMYMNL